MAINVDAKDRLRWALHTQGGQEVILVSASGQSIRFSEEDVRSMGLAAGGVGGMRLKRGDRVVSAHVVDPGGELATITELGYAKRTGLDQYSSQGRNGGGIVTHKVSSRTGKVAAAYLLPAQGVESLIVLQEKGDVKLVETEAVPQMGRGVMGKQVTLAASANRVAAVKAAAAALTADDIAAGVVEQTVAPPGFLRPFRLRTAGTAIRQLRRPSHPAVPKPVQYLQKRRDRRDARKRAVSKPVRLPLRPPAGAAQESRRDAAGTASKGGDGAAA